MKALVKYLALILLTTAILLGYQKVPNPAVPLAEDIIGDVSAYFPIESKMTWVYHGEGKQTNVTRSYSQ